ncbi:MAG: hypothetical protein CVT95_07320 [Bacteroidetes bacterium HGW-Bacteroidetes-12]|nr:MAG: hypothetical protein CVT95_07320 [Bacteroidetes bacterium HGW-Bacteroidetes-12]
MATTDLKLQKKIVHLKKKFKRLVRSCQHTKAFGFKLGQKGVSYCQIIALSLKDHTATREDDTRKLLLEKGIIQ